MPKKIAFFYIPLFLLSFVLLSACKGQKDTEPPKENIQPIEQATSKPADVDPYFTASTSITSPSGPKSITRNILQDKQGHIWLATWEGIIRYDGDTFTNFTNKETLRPFHVFCILEDRIGNIWFGTIGAGIYLYDGNTFNNITAIEDGLVSDRIGCIYEDKAGRIWIGTEGGISRYDRSAHPKGEISFRNFTREDGLANTDVNAILEDKDGKIWIGTRGDAFTYDGEAFSPVSNAAGMPFVNIRSIIEDQTGNIWLGGNPGLWYFDGQSFTQRADTFIGYIYEDRKGDLWTSSVAGSIGNVWALSRYDKAYLFEEKAAPIYIRQEENMFFGIWEDRAGGIWWGTLRGVCRYDGEGFNCFQ